MVILDIPHPASRIPWRLSIPNFAPQFLFAFKSWNLACENIRFSALFAAGSLVPGVFGSVIPGLYYELWRHQEIYAENVLSPALSQTSRG